MERIAMRGPCTFRKRDVTRAIQAVIAAGIEGRVEIEPNGIVIVIGKSAAQNFVVPIAATITLGVTSMPRKLPPLVERWRDRHGKMRHYFRKGKGARFPLPWSRRQSSKRPIKPLLWGNL
jgi:hypothetical protein